MSYSPSIAPESPDLEMPEHTPAAGSFGLIPQSATGTPIPPGLEDGAQQPVETEGGQQAIPLDQDLDLPTSVGEPSREPSPQARQLGLSPDLLQAEPGLSSTTNQPTPPTTQPSSLPQLDPLTVSLYQPATDEDFTSHRRRFDMQETISFGPYRRQPQHQSPYDKPPSAPDAADVAMTSFDIEDIETTALPPGWKFEDGYITLDDPVKDYGELKAGRLIRHHVVPRRALFDPRLLSARDQAHIPVPLDKIDPVRVTVCRNSDGIWHKSDLIDHGHGTISKIPWTGCTVFQINGETRRELGCYAYSAMTAKQIRKVRKATPKNEISERKLSLEDRLLFHQAKVKELKSFFDNGVWSFQTTKEADESRTLSSRMLLKWSKNADGTPRAKARLVVRGYADQDALNGELDTASPASTRLGRAMFLTLSACLGWCGWSADVSTAFLQGLPQERKLWVRLPADALRILGGNADTRMYLIKPVYGHSMPRSDGSWKLRDDFDS